MSLPTDVITRMNAYVTATPGVGSVDKMVESAFTFIGGRVCPQIKTKS